MNILIIKLSAIGDVIHTLPVLNALRTFYPDANITWLVEEAAADLVTGHEALDRILVSRRKQWIKQLKTPLRKPAILEIFRFIRDLRDTRYDLILDLQALLKSGMLVALAKGGRKVGFGPGMAHQEYSYLFLNEWIPAVSMEIHALERGLMLIEKIGIPHDAVEYKIPVTIRDRQRADALLKSHQARGRGPLIAINPVAKWETKLWDVASFSRLADGLVEKYNATVIFTGSPADRGYIDAILLEMDAIAENLAGKTSLKVLAALYEKSDLLISTDTGPMHLGAAVGLPVVALFGPTAPWRTGPFGPGHKVVRSEIACSPCFNRHCDTIDCMKNITVEQVLTEIRELVL